MTTPLFRKLNLGDHRRVHVLDAPASFEAELAALDGIAVARDLPAGRGATWVLAFATTCDRRDAVSAAIAHGTVGDAVAWIAYPKTSSRRVRGEFTRDTGWAVLGAAGFEPVRQVAIDDDWSALRFRRVEHIARLTRHPDGAISAGGRARAAAKTPGAG